MDTRYELAPAVAPEALPPIEALAQHALASRPELKALERGIAKAKVSRAVAYTEWLPDVTGRIEARQFRGESGVREYDTFVGISVPVWSLLKGISGEWKAAGREVQEARAMYDEMKAEVLLAVYEAESKAKAAVYAVRTYEQQILPKAKQQAEVGLAAYEAGRTDFLSLLDAQRMLRDARIQYARFVADRDLALADLRLAVGSDDIVTDPGVAQ
jgi:outer membrane protein TolC